MRYTQKSVIFFFLLKTVCVTCQDQAAVLAYFTYLSNFTGLHSTALRRKPHRHTAAGPAFQTTNALEADCFPVPALPQQSYSPPSVPAPSDSFSGNSGLRNMS